MSQYTTHSACYNELELILQAFQAGGYTRLVNYAPGKSVMFDSNPTPGYVPGVLGKRDTGIDYKPNIVGNTRGHFYYSAGTVASEKAKAEAKVATDAGYDPNELIGSLVSIKRTNDGNILLQIVASNRVTLENGQVVLTTPTIRNLSIKRNPAEGGGVLAAMALDQMLGIPYHQLQALLDSEKAKYTQATTVTGTLHTARASGLAKSNTDAPNTTGATGHGVGEEAK